MDLVNVLSAWYQHPVTPWVLFNAFVLLMLVLDLFVFHRHAHVIGMKEAVAWSLFWIGLAASFSLVLWQGRGGSDAVKYLTGYVVELSLSVDNLFVFLMLFAYFRVPTIYQHSVLFWGIVGAVVMRVVFILLGVALINRLHWIMFVFGGFLVVTGLKMALKSDEEIDPERNPVLKLARRFLPVAKEYDGRKFLTRVGGALVATPLLVVLLVVETTDVVFAVDSVPAVIGVIQDPVTRQSDPFIAYTSNIFAILGLRAMFFALSGLMRTFHLLHYGLAGILTFVGVKMLLEACDFYGLLPFHAHVPTATSLSVIALVLLGSVLASLLIKPKAA